VLSLDAIARALTLDLFDLLPAVSFDEARRRAFVHLRQLPVGEVKDFLNAFAHAKVSLPTARGKRIALVGLRAPASRRWDSCSPKRLRCPFIELDKISSRTTARQSRRCSMSTDRARSAATSANA